MTLMNAERDMLLHISNQPFAISCVQLYFREDAIALFRHLHKAGLLEPINGTLGYTISERGRAALRGDGAAPDHRHALDYLRDAGETW